LKLFIKASWKSCITVFKNIKHRNCFWRFILIVYVSWASNQDIRMISQRSCDTEDCNYGCWKFSFVINGINYILKCIKIESYRDPKGTFAKIKNTKTFACSWETLACSRETFVCAWETFFCFQAYALQFLVASLLSSYNKGNKRTRKIQ